MKLNKLAPWNWFKHEDKERQQASAVPVHSSSMEPWRSEPSSLMSNDPWLNLHRQIDRLFEDAWNAFGQFPSSNAFGRNSLFGDTGITLPKIDIAADDNKYEITLDVPGLSSSDIDIQVHDKVLTIRGHKEESHENKDKHYYRMERRSGSFQRTLSLPNDAVEDDITARVKDGVLKLEIPRRELPQENVKRISISS
jgi:HSP20 family protein